MLILRSWSRFSSLRYHNCHVRVDRKHLKMYWFQSNCKLHKSLIVRCVNVFSIYLLIQGKTDLPVFLGVMPLAVWWPRSIRLWATVTILEGSVGITGFDRLEVLHVRVVVCLCVLLKIRVYLSRKNDLKYVSNTMMLDSHKHVWTQTFQTTKPWNPHQKTS